MALNCYYVYTLADPRNGEVFYVGKGKGKRLFQHEIRARKHDLTNPKKTEKIIEIIKAGFRPLAEIQIHNLSESSAFEQERKLINSIGRDNLTNMQSGRQTIRERAEFLLGQMKPFRKWLYDFMPTREQEPIYFEIQNELKRIADAEA